MISSVLKTNICLDQYAYIQIQNFASRVDVSENRLSLFQETDSSLISFYLQVRGVIYRSYRITIAL
jgi:hypothetical protein